MKLPVVAAGLAALVAAAMAWPDSGLETRVYFLDLQADQVLTVGPDGEGRTVLVDSHTDMPDGIAVDAAEGWVYWTNMGVPSERDGTVARARIDGTKVQTIVASGLTHTPKQLQLDDRAGKLYWCDREGMRVQRSNVDGSELETLVEIAPGHAVDDLANWCVGMALDIDGRMFYWSQKGHEDRSVGSIRRAGFDITAGERPDARSDVEILFEGLPEPIDLALDVGARMLYWTDRGDNTVSRAPMHPPAGVSPSERTDREILVRGLSEAIGLSLDLDEGRMYFSDLGGSLGTATLDGHDVRTLTTGRVLTGVHVTRIPVAEESSTGGHR